MPSTDPVTVAPPKHPLYALTTYELRDRRGALERALAGVSPDAPNQAELRSALDAVLAEQKDRLRPTQAAGARASEATP
jgi:hypothetical protein